MAYGDGGLSKDVRGGPEVLTWGGVGGNDSDAHLCGLLLDAGLYVVMGSRYGDGAGGEETRVVQSRGEIRGSDIKLKRPMIRHRHPRHRNGESWSLCALPLSSSWPPYLLRHVQVGASQAAEVVDHLWGGVVIKGCRRSSFRSRSSWNRVVEAEQYNDGFGWLCHNGRGRGKGGGGGGRSQ